jgi:hypothetical protein
VRADPGRQGDVPQKSGAQFLVALEADSGGHARSPPRSDHLHSYQSRDVSSTVRTRLRRVLPRILLPRVAADDRLHRRCSGPRVTLRSTSSWPRSHCIHGRIGRLHRQQTARPEATSFAACLRRAWWALPYPRAVVLCLTVQRYCVAGGCAQQKPRIGIGWVRKRTSGESRRRHPQETGVAGDRDHGFFFVIMLLVSSTVLVGCFGRRRPRRHASRRVAPLPRRIQQ